MGYLTRPMALKRLHENYAPEADARRVTAVGLDSDYRIVCTLMLHIGARIDTLDGADRVLGALRAAAPNGIDGFAVVRWRQAGYRAEPMHVDELNEALNLVKAAAIQQVRFHDYVLAHAAGLVSYAEHQHQANEAHRVGDQG